MLTRRAAMTAALAWPLSSAAAGGPPSPPTIDELLMLEGVKSARLSPSGKLLAVLHAVELGDKREARLYVLSMQDIGSPPTVVPVGSYDVEQISWASEERLLLRIAVWEDAYGNKLGFWWKGAFIRTAGERLVAVGADGSNPVVLFSKERDLFRAEARLARIVDSMPGDPDHVLLQVWNRKLGAEALYRGNVNTGGVELVEVGGQSTIGWHAQNGVPVLKVDSNARGTTAWIYGRGPNEKGWRLLRKSRFNEQRKLPEFDIVGSTEQPGVILVCSRLEGADKAVIRTFDVVNNTFGAVICQRDDAEITGALVDQRRRFVAGAYIQDRIAYQFVDPSLSAHFRALNAYFGNRANVRIHDAADGQQRFILAVSGPTQPTSFYHYDRASGKVTLLGTSQRRLTAERLAPMRILEISTRDGARITAYLTTPISASARPPLVVLPHGGPEARDAYDWNIWAQALAAQGWAVLQPNFRGSGGYGKAFADLGRRQWGGRMQDDVEDAMAQVLASGLADPKKVAICGLSYGGYAALEGAVRSPQRYRAVVSIAGDADLIQTLRSSRDDDGADSRAYEYWVSSIGDPKQDEQMLRAASPALHAEQIQAPVLLIHGTEDAIVDPKQSRLMAKALETAGKPYEYLELKGEGHTGWSDDTLKLVLKTTCDFIAKAMNR